MPTDVHFIGAEDPVRVEEDYDAVKSALHGSDGQYNRLSGMTEDRRRVTIYKSAVAYIAEAPELNRCPRTRPHLLERTLRAGRNDDDHWSATRGKIAHSRTITRASVRPRFPPVRSGEDPLS